MRISKRTARLIREAAVLGYANGFWDGRNQDPSVENEPYPKDSVIFEGVLRGARHMRDLYPLLSKVELPEDD